MVRLVAKTANVLPPKAFQISSHYDSAIFNYFNEDTKASTALKVSQQEAKTLRYGENPRKRELFMGL